VLIVNATLHGVKTIKHLLSTTAHELVHNSDRLARNQLSANIKSRSRRFMAIASYYLANTSIAIQLRSISGKSFVELGKRLSPAKLQQQL
jgi:hypothetical protein